jgi:hypothetical protein
MGVLLQTGESNAGLPALKKPLVIAGRLMLIQQH